MLTPQLGNRLRLRVAAVELQPVISKRVIKGELRIDGKVVDELPPIEVGQPLKWTKLIICDVFPSSRFHLVVHERHLRIHSQYESESCLVSEIMQESVKKLKISINNIDYTAVIKVFDQADVNDLCAKGQDKMVEMEEQAGSFGKLRATQRIFKTMLQFGSAVAEIHPTAKIVFAVCTCAWTRLEEQQKSDEQLDELAGRLVGMVPLVEEVRKYAQLELLHHNIEEFLHLIEDVSIFVMSRETKRPVVRLIQSFVDSGDKDRIDQLEKQFRKVSDTFSMAIGVQTMAAVMTSLNREQELLKQLDPVKPSGHDPSQACQEGTRLSVLNDIDSWIHSTASGPPLMWMYGQAGMGKSTISASVCERLSKKGTPTVSFFCKRDDPARRDPLRLISSIVYGLACRYPLYGKLVAASIAADPELCTSHLEVRYEGLLKNPLIKLQNTHVSSPYILLIDALDECGTNEARSPLLAHLCDLSSYLPWLKVLITSRPDSDIRSFFDQYTSNTVSRNNLHDYPAANDIRAYIEACLGKIDVDEDWPMASVDKLCTIAGGLFIWAATACKLIASDLDPVGQLQQLIHETPSGSELGDLDSLYMAVIRNSAVGQRTTGTVYMCQCIGAIVVTSTKQPVPVETLCELLRDFVKPAVVKNVVKRLGAILYTDEKLDGAVRVYHPSFADFALDKDRSGEFWVDPVQRNIELLHGCISTMVRELEFNICGLETSHLPNSQLPDLGHKIGAKISNQLAYSCVFWIGHIFDSKNKTLSASQSGNMINGPRLLYWFEVLSLLQKVDVAVNGLRELSSWLSDVDMSRSIWDAYRFALAFFDPIATSTPHIYVSALALAPKQSEIHRRLSPLFPNTAKVTKGENERWPAWLRSISHPGRVISVCTSRDSRMLIAGCGDGGVRIYDLRTGLLTRTLRVESAVGWGVHVDKVAISPDGVLIACGTYAKVQIWDLSTSDTVASISAEEILGGMILYDAFSFANTEAILRVIVTPSITSRPVTSELVIGDITWDKGSTRIIKHTFPTPPSNTGFSPNEPTCIRFSPDLSCLVIGYRDGRMTLQPNLTGSTTLSFETVSDQFINAIAFSPDGSMIASTHKVHPHKVELWDTRTGAAAGVELIGHTESITSIAFSQDGTRIVTGSDDRTVRNWDTKTGSPIGGPLLGHSDEVNFVDFSCDGIYVVSNARDNTILVWDTSANTSPTNYPPAVPTHSAATPHDLSHDSSLPGLSRSVSSVGFSPDGTRIISGSYTFWRARDGTQIHIWDALTGEAINAPRYNCDDTHISNLAYSSDGDRIIGQGWGRAYIWDTRTGNRKDIEINPPAAAHAFSPDGARFVVANATHELDSDSSSQLGRIVMLDTGTGDKVGEINLMVSGAQFITFSPDNSRLYSYYLYDREDGVKTGKMYIYDTQTYDVVQSWDRDDDVAFCALSPNGGLLAGYSTVIREWQSITVHDAHTGNIISNSFSWYGPSLSVAFSPDETLLASSSGLGGISLWDIKSDNAISTRLTGHTDYVNSVAFSPDGTILVSGSSDRTIRLWEVNPSIAEPWDSESTACWPTSAYHFPPHPTHPDWVSHDQKSLTLWLPSHYRRKYDIHALDCISADPARLPVHIDFSKFVHGPDWTSVRSEEALRNYDAPK